MEPSNSGRRNLWREIPKLVGQAVRFITSTTPEYQELISIREQVEVLETANLNDAAELETIDKQLQTWSEHPSSNEAVLRASLTQVDKLGARITKREAELTHHSRWVTGLLSDLHRRQHRQQAENVLHLVSVEYNVVSNLRRQAETLEQHVRTLQMECQAQQKRNLEFEWVRIPAGSFLMGTDKAKDKLADHGELPQHTVCLPEYHITRTPVTHAQYKQFVDATNYRAPYHWTNGQIPSGKEQHPMTHVSWRDAMTFCQWAGVRLPTEAEWEKAARGTDGRIYPWGNEPPDKERCNYRPVVGDTTPVGSYPHGASPYGLLDMSGNVLEWTSSQYLRYPYKADDGREIQARDAIRTLRGGAFHYFEYGVRCAARYGLSPAYTVFDIGFRVVRHETAREN